MLILMSSPIEHLLPKSLPVDIRLMSGGIDLVLFRIDEQPDTQTYTQEARLSVCLSATERRRYAQIVPENARRRRIVGRALLRYILGRYCAVPPERLRFGYGRHGKPMLLDGHVRYPYFNLSHSGGWALLALSAEREVGVDLQRVRPLRREAAILDFAFTAAERRHLNRLPAERRLEALLACWTRKEALIKLYGGNILALAGECSLPTSPLCTLRRYRPPAALTALANLGRRLVIHDLELLPNFRAAFCYPIGPPTRQPIGPPTDAGGRPLHVRLFR